MVGGFVEEENVRLYEKSSCKGYTHPPSTTHVLSGLLHHRLRESETVEDASGLGLERTRIHLLKFLVRGIQCQFVYILGNGKLLDISLKSSYLLLGRSDDEVDGIDIRWLCLSADEIDVNVRWDFDVTLGNRREESRLGGSVQVRSQKRDGRSDLSGPVFAKQSIPLSIIQGYLRSFD